MNRIAIDTTAQEFSSWVGQEIINSEREQDLAYHMRAVMDQKWPGVPDQEVNAQLVFNQCDRKSNQVKQGINREIEKWISSGQLDMFGLPAHLLPPRFTDDDGSKRPGTQMTPARAKREVEQLSEMRRQEWQESEEKARRDKARYDFVVDQLKAIVALNDAMTESGYDPEAMTYEQIQALHAENPFPFGDQTGLGDSPAR